MTITFTPMRPLEKGEQRLHHHPEAGHFYVSRNNGFQPVVCPFRGPLEFFCAGVYYRTEEDAVKGFFDQWDQPEVPDVSDYARMEARMISPGVFEE